MIIISRYKIRDFASLKRGLNEWGYYKRDKDVGSGNRDLVFKLDRAVNSLDFLEKAVIECRHVKKYHWYQMPYCMPVIMSERTCYRIYSEALNKINLYLSNNP